METRNSFYVAATLPTLRLRALRLALLSVLFALGAFVQPALAQSVPAEVTNGTAKLVQPADPNQMLRVVLGLERPHVAEEEQFLADLHTRGTNDYRHFLTIEEWTRRFGPSQQDEQAVVEWAKSRGLKVTYRFPHRLVVDLESDQCLK